MSALVPDVPQHTPDDTGSAADAVMTLTGERTIPGLDIVRPGDANETVYAWQTVLEHTDRPRRLAVSAAGGPRVGGWGILRPGFLRRHL